MKTKLIIAGLAVVLELAAFGVTGCKPSQPDNTSQTTQSTATNQAAQDSNTNKTAATPDTSTNQPAPEIKPAQAVQYTCSMHPEVVQDKPGNCPKCGMKLVIKK